MKESVKYFVSDPSLIDVARSAGITNTAYRELLILYGKEKILDELLFRLKSLVAVVPSSIKSTTTAPEVELYNYVIDLEHKIRSLELKSKINYGE